MPLKNTRKDTGSIPLEHLEKYRALRKKIDKLCSRLEKIHSDHMVCKAGCTECCMDFSLFPVEYYSILNEIADSEIVINTKAKKESCLFLSDGLCSIYNSRPIICRTHGLPLLFMGEEEWQMSVCELNFTGEDIPEFSESNTFPQDRFNSELFMLNREFVCQHKELGLVETELLSLRELAGRKGPEGPK